MDLRNLNQHVLRCIRRLRLDVDLVGALVIQAKSALPWQPHEIRDSLLRVEALGSGDRSFALNDGRDFHEHLRRQRRKARAAHLDLWRHAQRGHPRLVLLPLLHALLACVSSLCDFLDDFHEECYREGYNRQNGLIRPLGRIHRGNAQLFKAHRLFWQGGHEAEGVQEYCLFFIPLRSKERRNLGLRFGCDVWNRGWLFVLLMGRRPSIYQVRNL